MGKFDRSNRVPNHVMIVILYSFFDECESSVKRQLNFCLGGLIKKRSGEFLKALEFCGNSTPPPTAVAKKFSKIFLLE